MKVYIGYIRVSTVKQGTQGVSLQEQREAILRYAERNRLTIGIWLEEMETAARQGRPVFNRALKLLRGGSARGIILHKLDRGARNLRDWAAIGELSDQGVEIHFVSEGLDLQSRGGRLSADIQAVVAADYIRNLREETRKGFYGRLKQGLYPLQAPLGYADQGRGRAKTIDPVMGPIVKQAFELYSSARFNLDSLGDELHRLGLRNRRGSRVSRNGLSTLLNNPFYFGLIQLQKTSETFAGVHEPLISKILFDGVQRVLRGKTNTRSQQHRFQFRRLFACRSCHYSLVGEHQKGHVYYRCHSQKCPPTSVREEIIEAQVENLLRKIRLNEQELAYLKAQVQLLKQTWTTRQDQEVKHLNIKLGQIKDRFNRLTDAYLDQVLDKSMFEARKQSLLLEQKDAENQLASMNGNSGNSPNRIEKFLELVGNVWLSHQNASPEERRELLSIITSNRIVDGKIVELEPSLPFRVIVERPILDCCDPEPDISRMLDSILETLITLNHQGLLPDLSAVVTSTPSEGSVELNE